MLDGNEESDEKSHEPIAQKLHLSARKLKSYRIAS